MLGMFYRDRECSRRIVMKKECYSAWQEIKKKTADCMEKWSLALCFLMSSETSQDKYEIDL